MLNAVTSKSFYRPIIFRNSTVPELPVSSLEETEAIGLWERLDEGCREEGG